MTNSPKALVSLQFEGQGYYANTTSGAKLTYLESVSMRHRDYTQTYFIETIELMSIWLVFISFIVATRKPRYESNSKSEIKNPIYLN